MTISFSGANGIWNPNQNQNLTKFPIDITICDDPKDGGIGGKTNKELPPWVHTENPKIPMIENTPGICYLA